MTPDQLAAFAGEVRAAHAAMDGKGPGTPEWAAYFAIKERWITRPRDRDAAPGDLQGPQLPGEWPPFGGVKCRRCHLDCSLEGHPDGCPRTPGYYLDALIRCYCGQALVVPPDTFGPCCAGTPPVPLPGGCRVCGSNLCRVNNPDDQPEHTYYVPDNHPDMGRDWVHAHCIDDDEIARGRPDDAERRRAKRQTPIGMVNP